jgi:hypothetical protein
LMSMDFSLPWYCCECDDGVESGTKVFELKSHTQIFTETIAF